MYQISELARKLGLSRSTLLYYEKMGIVCAKRAENGYRIFDEQDRQRLLLLQQLQAGGLSLKECKACFEAKIDRLTLRQRLTKLEDEINQKEKARHLLRSLLGESSLKDWHEQLNATAPEAHLNWLMYQGFPEKEALRLKWLSKDMNEHEDYMADFMKVFETLDFWGPGSPKDTDRAFQKIPSIVKNIIEIGCGKGVAKAPLRPVYCIY